MDTAPFQSHYIPNTPDTQREMLQFLGIKSVEELFADIPQQFRDPPLDLPPPISELELRREMESLAQANRNLNGWVSFLGAGAYNHFSPSIVGHIINRGEFLTSYTPYQAEASQGTLQATYEFQTMVCNLLGMEVANAGMYEGATSLAEAALMACRVTGRKKIAVLDSVSPIYRNVLTTYTRSLGIDVLLAEASKPVMAESPSNPGGQGTVRNRDETVDEDTACLIVQHPNFYGYLEDLTELEQIAHQHGALLVVSTDPLASGLFRPPGDYGADIVTAEGQPLGIPLSFGGPYVGLFATRQKHLRQMPGRIVGRTVDSRGRTGYTLTLQTREQHIRRERATSNICTTQSLLALATTVYMATLGKRGLRQVTELCYHKAHYAASLISQIPGFSLLMDGAFFKEFTVQCPIPPSEINSLLKEHGILGGLDISYMTPNGWLLCVTEMNTRQEIEDLASVLSEVATS